MDRIDLFVLRIPGLERLIGAAPARPAELIRSLTRGRYREVTPGAALSALLRSPALPEAGPLSRLGTRAEAPPAEGSVWLRADAVRMIPDLTAVWIDRPLTADLCSPELEPMRRELDAMFAAEGLAWIPEPGAAHALLRLDELPDCDFVGPLAARGGRLDEALPTGRGALRWRRLMNESQMIFHRFRSLDRADQHGAGLWFWGAGTGRGRAGERPELIVHGHRGDALALGLARWLGAHFSDGDAFGRGDHRRVLCRWHPEASGSSWQQLEGVWLVPAADALQRGRLKRLAIVGDRGTWQLGRWSRWARWRRNAAGLVDDPVQR